MLYAKVHFKQYLGQGATGSTEEAVAVVEQDLGFLLPADYRAFLISCNGGAPSPSIHPPSRVRHLFPVCEGKTGIIWHRRVFEGRVPNEYLAIGSDPFGNLWCVAVNGEDKGSIWFWDHEREDGPTPANMTRVADSFVVFCGGFR